MQTNIFRRPIVYIIDQIGNAICHERLDISVESANYGIQELIELDSQHVSQAQLRCSTRVSFLEYKSI